MDLEYQRILFNICDDDIVHHLAAANVTENMVVEGLRLILEWYQKQPHLPPNGLDPDVLNRFFGGCGYSVEKVKKKIDAYLSMKSIFPEILCNKNPFSPDILTTLKNFQYAIVPHLTPEKHRVLICKYLTTEANFFDPLACYKYSFMIGDMRMKYDVSHGDRVILDLKNFTLAHVLKTPPSLAKKYMYILQNCYTHQVKGVHILNFPSYAANLLAFMKTVAKKKIIERMHFHNSLEELYQFIPAKILPVEYGGQNSTCDELADRALKIMQSDLWKQRFIDSDNIKSDESKRLDKTDDRVGDLLGIMGTFRKLDID